MLAVNDLLIEVATDLVNGVVGTSMGVTLMGIYNSGKMPGQLANPKLNEVALTLKRHSPKRASNFYKKRKK